MRSIYIFYKVKVRSYSTFSLALPFENCLQFFLLFQIFTARLALACPGACLRRPKFTWWRSCWLVDEGQKTTCERRLWLWCLAGSDDPWCIMHCARGRRSLHVRKRGHAQRLTTVRHTYLVGTTVWTFTVLSGWLILCSWFTRKFREVFAFTKLKTKINVYKFSYISYVAV